jgi:hypothetical protein
VYPIKWPPWAKGQSVEWPVYRSYAQVDGLTPFFVEDVRVVQLKNPRMDRAYIEKWLKDFEKTLDRPLVENWKKL